MKKILFLIILLTSNSLFACEKHLNMQIEELKKVFKEGANQGFETLNKEGLNVKTSFPETNYSVCYEFRGKELYRIASSKEILPNENVTNNKKLVKIVKTFFKEAGSNKVIDFEYNKVKKIAKSIDVNILDSNFEKGKAICVAENIAQKH